MAKIANRYIPSGLSTKHGISIAYKNQMLKNNVFAFNLSDVVFVLLIVYEHDILYAQLSWA